MSFWNGPGLGINQARPTITSWFKNPDAGDHAVEVEKNSRLEVSFSSIADLKAAAPSPWRVEQAVHHVLGYE